MKLQLGILLVFAFQIPAIFADFKSFSLQRGEDERFFVPDFSYCGCFDSWQNFTRETDKPRKYNEGFTPESCAAECYTTYGGRTPFFLLKGAECICKSDVNLVEVPPRRCNIPCPVKDMSHSPTTASPTPIPNDPYTCGGNMQYSVYSFALCPISKRRDRAQERLSGFENVLEKSGEPLYCGYCEQGKPCSSHVGYHFTPDYDYFPRLNVEDCWIFCKDVLPYIHSSAETVRPGRSFAVLMWDSAITKLADPVPICHCRDDLNGFLEADKSKCNSPCPGDGEEACGREDPEEGMLPASYYGSIYCIGAEECGNFATTTVQPSTSTQTTTATVTTSSSPTTTTVKGPVETTTETLPTGNCDTETTTEKPETPKPATEPPMWDDTDEPSTESVTTTYTTSTTTTSTSGPTDPGQGIHCGLICEGFDHASRRHWTVCSGQREEKDCGIHGSIGTSFWDCTEEGVFATEQPDYSGCKSDWLDDLVEESEHLNNTESVLPYLQKLKDNVLPKLENGGEGRPSYFGHEIAKISTILEIVVNVSVKEVEKGGLGELENVVEKAVDIGETIVGNEGPWHELDRKSRANASIQLLKTVETVSFQLPSAANSSTYQRELVHSSLLHVMTGSLSPDSNASFSFPSETSAGRISLPPGWKNFLRERKDAVNFVGILLSEEKANLFFSPHREEKDNSLINSKMLSFSLSTEKSLAIPESYPGIRLTFPHSLEAFGETPLQIRRKLHEGEEPKAVKGTGKCVFYNEKTFSWSEEGCRLVTRERGETICECFHLTSFSVLMSTHSYVGRDLGLQILTLLLSSLSFICLLTAFTAFTLFREVMSNERTAITRNLSLNLGIGNGMIILFVDRSYFDLSEGVCSASAVVTHYLFLTAFVWMGIEGIHLYRMVVHVFDSERNPLKWYRLVAYGLPGLVILITWVTGFISGEKVYGNDLVCWLNGSYIWSFLVPVIIVVVLNLVILFIALKTAYQVQHSGGTKNRVVSGQGQKEGKIRSFRIWLRGCLSLTIVLGTSWLLGFFTLLPDQVPNLIASYLFVIFNASQGILIFLFHCVYNEKIRSTTLSRFRNSAWFSSSLRQGPSSTELRGSASSSGSEGFGTIKEKQKPFTIHQYEETTWKEGGKGRVVRRGSLQKHFQWPMAKNSHLIGDDKNKGTMTSTDSSYYYSSSDNEKNFKK